MHFSVSHPAEKLKMLDITRDKPVKVAVKVAVPVRDHPKVCRRIWKWCSKGGGEVGSGNPLTEGKHFHCISLCAAATVQFRGQAARTQGQLDEAPAGGHHVQDGRSGTRIDARPAEGGGAAGQWRQSLRPSLRGPARRDLDLRRSGGGPCPDSLRSGGSAPLSGSGESSQ